MGWSGGSIPPCFDDAEREERFAFTAGCFPLRRKSSAGSVRAGAPFQVGDGSRRQVKERVGRVDYGSIPHSPCELRSFPFIERRLLDLSERLHSLPFSCASDGSWRRFDERGPC